VRGPDRQVLGAPGCPVRRPRWRGGCLGLQTAALSPTARQKLFETHTWAHHHRPGDSHGPAGRQAHEQHTQAPESGVSSRPAEMIRRQSVI
jgi:hypothetical protein